jgi:glycosyltransferase involved in cell wall biosynthesis
MEAHQTPGNKILWFLVGNPEFVASSRIHGLAVHNKLLELGYNSCLAYIPASIEELIPEPFPGYPATVVEPGDIVIFQKIKDRLNLNKLLKFRDQGSRVILLDCDLPIGLEVSKRAHKVIVTSRELGAAYRASGVESFFREDAPEIYFDDAKRPHRPRMNCVWFGDGSGQKWRDVEALKEIMRDPRLRNWGLMTISNHPDADIRWGKDAFELVKTAHVILLPVFTQSGDSVVKSANRLLQGMALSAPVICSPLPSYLDVVTPGKDAFVCTTPDQWIETILRLEDSNLREMVGKAAYSTAARYSLSNTINQWIDLLELDRKFKTIDPAQLRKEQNRISNSFYLSLLRRNINYWKVMRPSFANGFWYLVFRFSNLKKKLRNGNFLFWRG